MLVNDRYNTLKTYVIGYKGEHYTIQQFIGKYPVSKKLRLGLARIADITGKSKQYIKDNMKGGLSL